MGALADALGGKTPGELIRASDWNDLIAAIEAMDDRLTNNLATLSTSVDTRFTAVDGQIASLGGRVDALEERIDELADTVEALRETFRRVTLRTSSVRAPLGEVVEITGRVTDLAGNPLDLTNAATRPWIDFVTVWGQLKPAPGFESIGGVGDRSISVRVNAQGEARVLLRAQSVNAVAEADEAGVISALGVAVQGSNMTVAQAIMAAPTPMAARQNGAFRQITEEYNRIDARGVKNYADNYYLQNAHLVDTVFIPGLHQQWRDYRTTVMAFAKSDSDPLTADASLGSCAIQVTFRDWIGPWVVLDFLAEAEVLVPVYQDRFRGRIANDYTISLRNVKDEVEQIINGKGLIGKLRDYTAMEKAITQLDVRGAPSFLPDLAETLHSGIVVQHATEVGQALAIGLSAEPATFGAMAQTGSKADRQGAKVVEQVTGYVDQKIGTAQQQINFQVQQQQAAFRNELFAEDGMIQSVNRNVSVALGQVQGVQVALNQKADIQSLARFLPG